MVNNTMKIIVVIIPKAKRKKSDVKNGNPNKMNWLCKTSNLNNGFPLGNLKKGVKINIANNT